MSPVSARGRAQSRTATFPAPRKGWIRNTNLALSEKEGALLLDNWFPTTTGIRIRKGRTKHATVGAGNPVRAMFPYAIGGTSYLFAATDSAIYDITTPADADVSPAEAIGSLSSGDWSIAPIATAGGYFLRLVNGADTALVFDGSSWGTTPALTGVASEALSAVWLFKQRLFFVEGNSLNAWYLPVDSIGGALTKLPLGGVFRLGGSLLFGSSWSYDAAGGTGKADACVFVSTEGEVAIYEGSNPASASDWSLRGIYQIGRPLGKRAWFRSGGDLVIATNTGLIPVSQAVTVGSEALSPLAVSYPIEEEWKTEALARNAGWACTLWPKRQMAVVGMPHSDIYADVCFVVNIRTGAWGRYTNWNVECCAPLEDRLLFGTAAGVIMDAEVGGSDDGDIYTATYIGLHDDLKMPAALKVCNLMRATFLSTVATNRKVSVATNYGNTAPLAPNVATILDTVVWDGVICDDPLAIWQADPPKQPAASWSTVAGSGTTIAPCVQVSIGGVVEAGIDLVRTDIQYELGAVVV